MPKLRSLNLLQIIMLWAVHLLPATSFNKSTTAQPHRNPGDPPEHPIILAPPDILMEKAYLVYPWTVTDNHTLPPLIRQVDWT